MGDKFKINFILAFLAILFSSFGCTRLQDAGKDIAEIGLFNDTKKEVKIYFTKSKGHENVTLVSVDRKILKEDSVIEGAIKELFLGPTKTEELKGIMTEIPIGTRLINVEESEDEVLLDISPQYLTGGGSAAMQLRYMQIYKTLKKIAPTKQFYLQVDGKTLKSIGGEGLEVTQPLTKINDYTKKYEKTEDIKP